MIDNTKSVKQVKAEQTRDKANLNPFDGGDLANKIHNEFTERCVNVKWYGAVGDGETDDTKAIQDALDTGRSIFIPTGIYRVKNLKPRPGQIIRGENYVENWGSAKAARRTILKGIGGKDDYVIKNNVWAIDGEPYAVMLSDLTIDGNGNKTNGIKCQNTMTIQRVLVQKCINGIVNVSVSIVTNCQICDNTNGINGVVDSKIKDNFIFNNGTGINLYNSNDNIIASNKIEWNTVGISINESGFNLITGNIFDRNKLYGIDSDNTSHISVLNNLFERNSDHHIKVRGSSWNISGNSFFEKHEKDGVESSLSLPKYGAINVNSIFKSTISGNTVIGKMYGGGSEYVGSSYLFGNTINGMGDSEVDVQFASNESIVSGETKEIKIDYPKVFGLTNWSSRVIGYQIKLKETGESYSMMDGVSIKLLEGGVSLTVTNKFSCSITLSGSIYLKPTYFATL